MKGNTGLIDEIELLALHMLPYAGAATIRRILTFMVAKKLSFQDIISICENETSKELKLHPMTLERIVYGKESLKRKTSEIYNKLKSMKIRITCFDDAYFPEEVNPINSPPILYIRGNIKNIPKPRVCILSSSRTSPSSTAMALQAARSTIEKGIPAVTSVHAGIYNMLNKAYETAGVSRILILDRGVLRSGHAVSSANAAVISPFRPDDDWIARNGLVRDQLVIDFADIIIAIDIREDGRMHGLLRKATKRVKEVFVLKDDSSSHFLTREGAQLISPDDISAAI